MCRGTIYETILEQCFAPSVGILVVQEEFELTDVVIATVELSPSMEYDVKFSSLSPPPGGPPYFPRNAIFHKAAG